MFRNFKEIREKAKSLPKATVVVPMAEDEASLSAAIDGYKMGLINPILIGNREKMLKIAGEIAGDDLSNFEKIEIHDPNEAALAACKMCREKKAQVILKGSLQTSELFKAILNPEQGLRTETLLSDIFVYEDKLFNKLVGITDAAIIPLPDLDQKRQQLENAVKVFHRLGIQKPKVALLSAVEKVTPKIQSTVDAAELKKMYLEGKIKGCIVDGPLALDNAVSTLCAKIKGIKSEVSGDPDIFLTPNIEAGNIFAKSMVYYHDAKPGHVLMGAKVPIMVTSRVDDAESKLNSIAITMVTGIDR